MDKTFDGIKRKNGQPIKLNAIWILLLIFVVGCSIKNEKIKDQLWFSALTEGWSEAIPFGNGMQGGMVHGGVKKVISLMENTYYSGEVSNHIKDGASEYLPKIQEALISHDYQSVVSLSENITGNKSSYGTKLLLTNLEIIFDYDGEAKSYIKTLNPDNASAPVDCKIGNVMYPRKYLASNPDGVIAIWLVKLKKGEIYHWKS